MKVVILAGGLGTRLIEETKLVPKPMIRIGDMPILWHIMKYFSHFGHKEFIICLGYKGDVIRDFFINSLRFNGDIEIDLKENKINIVKKNIDDWQIKLINTGLSSNTAGRIKKIEKYIINDQNFLFTYGDGLINSDINKSIKFHKKHKKIATVTAVRPMKRFGVMNISKTKVTAFNEKPVDEGGWINGGYFVLSTKILKYIQSPNSVLEKDILPKLAKSNQLRAFHHNGFWHPLDTLRDKINLEKFWNLKNTPWKVW